MKWLLLNSGPGLPALNMALDETLLEAVARLSYPILRFYGWLQPAVTFGHLQKITEVEQSTRLRPLIRRPTGGGIVLHGVDWTYALAFPPDHEWYTVSATESYMRLHSWVRDAFAALQVSTELAPESRKQIGDGHGSRAPGACFIGHEKFDLLWHGRKIAGAAQRRNRLGLLIQGSVLTPISLPRKEWEKAMLQAAQSEFGASWSEFSPDQDFGERVRKLEREKYSQASYNRKR